MTQPKTIRFSGVVITVDDGSGANQVAPCGFTKKSVKFSAQSSDTVVPDCDSPDLPAWLERNIYSLSCEVQGSGVLAAENTKLWRGFWSGGVSRQCVITFAGAGANGGFSVTGNFVMPDWSIDADFKGEGGRAQQSVTLQNDGALVFADNP